MQAQVEEPRVEPRTPGGQPDIADEGQVHAGTDRGPLTAASVGSVDRPTRRQTSWITVSESRVAAVRLPRSAPAQKAGGAPVMTSAPTSSSTSRQSSTDKISPTR